MKHLHRFNPLANLPHEYDVSNIVRDAVDYDPDKERMYLLCSVGELAQRIAVYIATKASHD